MVIMMYLLSSLWAKIKSLFLCHWVSVLILSQKIVEFTYKVNLLYCSCGFKKKVGIVI